MYNVNSLMKQAQKMQEMLHELNRNCLIYESRPLPVVVRLPRSSMARRISLASA